MTEFILCQRCFHYTKHDETGCLQKVYFEGEWHYCQCDYLVVKYATPTAEGLIVSSSGEPIRWRQCPNHGVAGCEICVPAGSQDAIDKVLAEFDEIQKRHDDETNAAIEKIYSAYMVGGENKQMMRIDDLPHIPEPEQTDPGSDSKE